MGNGRSRDENNSCLQVVEIHGKPQSGTAAAVTAALCLRLEPGIVYGYFFLIYSVGRGFSSRGYFTMVLALQGLHRTF